MSLSIPTKCFALLAALFCGASAFAQDRVEISIEDGRIIAREAVLSGDPELARDFANALLQADPADRSALLILASAQAHLGNPTAARLAAEKAFAASDTPQQRYEAARLTALMAANEDRYTLSQFWLRRAAANAPDDQAYQQTRKDFQDIRDINPWSTTLEFTVAPSSNVNGGSTSEYNVIDGLPFIGLLSPEAQALSGVFATTDMRLAYAISRGSGHRTDLTLRANARTVWLSDEARKLAPDSSNSDFGSRSLEFGLNHQHRLGDSIVSAGGLLGTNWFGGDLNSGYLRGTLGVASPLSDRTRITFSGQFEQTYDPDPWLENNRRSTVSSGLSHVFETGNKLSGQVTYETQASDNLNERFESRTVQFSYAWAEPIGPMHLSVSAGVNHLQFPDYTIILPVPGGREDIRYFGSVQAVLQDLDYAGFVPVVSLGFQDTQSNVSRFDRNELSVSLGLRSSF